ncbi:helix-turn-helix domain-containing protein [Paraflavitalea pollutisoli]|uniref:helix-turn-helix domain-containing protein n=1 Tax=Paraflavitalea pollutisoli TaxID=3034143 RepID=UPI0023EDCE05|nr:AraC family transcriptional regulator [Paraflavitalea sp. H1-2-19X]
MKFNNIHSCQLGPEISPEHFIPEHFFLYLLAGSMVAYDGRKEYTLQPGDFAIARKNYPIRYTKYKDGDVFEKIIITLDEPFLQRFLERHPYVVHPVQNEEAFLFIEDKGRIHPFIQSLEPYYNGGEQIEETFVDVKREELLLILLSQQPGLADILFNFTIPEKIDLEDYMNRNFRFNLSLERFALMTGRSLSSFKRDFQKTFGSTPGHWLTQKRLEEAYFLLHTEKRKPNDVYAEVGFEDLSHFSFAFKKRFGKTPAEVRRLAA